MQRDDFLKAYPDITQEQVEALKIYDALLCKWQPKINLVGPKTMDERLSRHFIDSVQLVPFLQEIKVGAQVLDLGSGAGFPGAVLSILRPDLNVTLVESDERKTLFLRQVARETGSGFSVDNRRIEAPEVQDVYAPDMITARALASLEDLFGYCRFWAEQNPELKLCFLKGAGWREEVEQAKKYYDFEVKNTQSQTHTGARILYITALKAR